MDRSKSKTRGKSKLKKGKSKTRYPKSIPSNSRKAKSKIPKKKKAGAKKRGVSVLKKKTQKSLNGKKKVKKSVTRKKTGKKSVSRKPKKRTKSALKKKGKPKKKKIAKKKKAKPTKPKIETITHHNKLTIESDDEPAIRTTSGKIDLGEFQHEIIEQQRKNQGIVGTRFSSNLMDFKDRNMGMVREIVHNFEIKEGANEQETIMEIESNLNNVGAGGSQKAIANGGSSGNIKLANFLPEDLLKERDQKFSQQLSDLQKVMMNGFSQLTDLTKQNSSDPTNAQNNSEQIQGIVQDLMKNLQQNGLQQDQPNGGNVQNFQIPEHFQYRNSETNPITFKNSEKKNSPDEEHMDPDGAGGLKDSYVGNHESTKLNTLITNHGDLKDIFLKRGTIAMTNPTQDYTEFVRASLNDGDKEGPTKKLEKIPEGMTPTNVQKTGVGILGKPEISPGDTLNPFNNEMVKSFQQKFSHNEEFKQTQRFGENEDHVQSMIARQINSGKRISNFNKDIMEHGVDHLRVNMDILKHHEESSQNQDESNNKMSTGSQAAEQNGLVLDSANKESKTSNQIDDQQLEAKAEKQFKNYMNISNREKSRTKKGKDFRTTMSNIYSDIDKTLDYIEVEQMNDSERSPQKKIFSYKGLESYDDKHLETKEENPKEGLERKMKRFNSQVKLPLENMVKEEEKRSQQIKSAEDMLEEYTKKEVEVAAKPQPIKRFASRIPTILKQPRMDDKITDEPVREIEQNILSKFIKPAPKIYKRQKQGDKFLILAQDKDDLETRSFYSRKNHGNYYKPRAPSVTAASHPRKPKFSEDDWRSYPDRIRNRPQSARPERVTNKKSFKLSEEYPLENNISWGDKNKNRSETRSEIAVGNSQPKPMYNTMPQREKERERAVEGGNMLSQFSRVPTHAGTIRSSIDTQIEPISRSPNFTNIPKKTFRKSAQKDPEQQTVKAHTNRPFDTPTVYSRSLTQKESKFRFLRRKMPQRDSGNGNMSSTEPHSPEKTNSHSRSNRKIHWTIEKRKQRRPKASQRKNRFAQNAEISSQNENIEQNTASKIGIMSVDDMEAKLRILFKKMLVYGSKIETIKLKIDKMNGETSCYALYRRFCDPHSGELSVHGLKNLLQALNFPLKQTMLVKMLIYLSKFEPQVFGTGSLPPSQTDVYIESPYMHHSEVHSQNLFEQKNNLRPRLASNPQSYHQMHRGNMAHGKMFASLEGTLGAPQSPEQITLKYESFRQLFTSHKIQIPEIYLFCNWESQGPTNDVQLPESEYYLMRQILMLFQKQLKDMTRIMTALKPYSAEQMFEYLSSYSPDHMEADNAKQQITTQITFSVQSNAKNSNVNSHVEMANSPIPSFSNNNYAPYSPNTGGPQSSHFASRGMLKNSREQHDPRMVTHSGRVSHRKGLYHREDNEHPSVNVWNIKNFLEFQNVQYLEEDLMLLMNALASSEGSLEESTFYQFVYSPIWSL